MRAVAQILAQLFKVATRVSARTATGVLRSSTSRYARQAVRSLRLTTPRGVVIAYENLNAVDQAAVDAAVDMATRFAKAYIEHHDENLHFRLQAESLDDVVMSHAREILNAAQSAIDSKMRSSMYDAATHGRPAFADNELLKQMVLAVIQEVSDHLDEA